jgi:predicted LPLAT superfamily acyltransferase
MSNVWTKEKERSNVFSLRLICWIALNFPRKFARIFLYPITLYFLLMLPKVRFSSKKYFERIPNQKSGFWQIAKHIFTFSATILDRVYFLTGKYKQFNIEIVGSEVLEAVSNSNKGAILLGAHIGSLDVFHQHYKDIPVNMAMYHNHNSMIGSVLKQLNPKIANSIIDLEDDNALFKIQESIENKYLVAMLGDRITEKTKEVHCQLLGDKVSIPTGPVTLAIALKSPIIMFFGVYLGGNKYKLYFKKLTQDHVVARKDREKEVAKYLQEYTSYIESIIKKHPFNWFNFFNYWNDKK